MLEETDIAKECFIESCLQMLTVLCLSLSIAVCSWVVTTGASGELWSTSVANRRIDGDFDYPFHR